MKHANRRPTPALFVALIALVVALAGTATALPGKNTVDKNDIKKNAVKSKAIKNGQVKLADLAANSVDGSKIVDGAVAAADLTDPEAVHLVGGVGEPAFGNGAEGDCVWTNASAVSPVFGPSGFHKDPSGYVHLQGIAVGDDAPGGDGLCNDTEDLFAFTLPAGYAPDTPVVAGAGGGAVLIAPDEGIVAGADVVPPGTVVAIETQDAAIMDAVTFRAAGPATTSTKQAPIKVDSLEQAAELLR